MVFRCPDPKKGIVFVFALVLLLPCTVPARAAETGIIGRYAALLGDANARLSITAREELAQRLLMIASYYRIDPALLTAIVTAESSWRAHAVSPVGALGYGQLMPGTAAALRVDALEPYENLDGAARYLRRMLMHFASPSRSQEQRVRLAVASYNAGPAAVDRYGRIPPYRETANYVVTVLRLRDRYAMAGTPSGRELVRSLAAAHVPPAPLVVPPMPALAASPRKPVKAATARTAPRVLAYAAPRHIAASPHKVRRRSAYIDAPDPNAYETPPPSTRKKRHGIAGLFQRIFVPLPGEDVGTPTEPHDVVVRP